MILIKFMPYSNLNHRRRIGRVLPALILSTALVACGGSESGTSAPPSATIPPVPAPPVRLDAPIINLSSLTAEQGFVFDMPDIRGDLGHQVANIGDVNNDTIQDIAITSPTAPARRDFGDGNGTIQTSQAGVTSVIFGSRTGFGEAVNGRQLIRDTIKSDQGFTVLGTSNNGRFGEVVSKVGDINADGIADFAIGGRSLRSSPGMSDTRDAGIFPVIFGKSSTFGVVNGVKNELDIEHFSLEDGVIIRGKESGDAGSSLGPNISLSGLGDINGDGIDDMIVGTPRNEDGGRDAGQAYVIFGKDGNLGEIIEFTEYNFSEDIITEKRIIDVGNLKVQDGFAIQGGNGVTVFDFGRRISSAGDINNDGLNDILFSYAGGRRSHVVFGQSEFFNSEVEGLAVLRVSELSPDQGLTLTSSKRFSGLSASGIGDINGDGIDDIIIGAPERADNLTDSEYSYIVFGNSDNIGDIDGETRTLDLDQLTPSQGLLVKGIAPGDGFGFSVNAAGDINNDGFQDVIIGAITANGDGDKSGEVYVIYGKMGALGIPIDGQQVLDISTLSDQEGFKIHGHLPEGEAGFSVAGAGDVNQDGFDDIIIGARSAETAYIVFGKPSP